MESRDSMAKKSEVTHNLLPLLDTSLDLWNMSLRVIVERLFDLTFAQDRQVLLDGKLTLAKALSGSASGHFFGWSEEDKRF